MIHALHAAGGTADCTMCPAYRVCTKQCLTIAAAVERMIADGSLPQLGETPPPEPSPEGGGGGHLKVIK